MGSDWRVSQGCPYFMVSIDGRILISDTKEFARIADNGSGYKQVQIMRCGKRYTRYVHRLVAECFIDNPNQFPEVNHKDGNKSNNSADNLEWCNHSENLKHAYRTGLRPNTTPKQQEAARRNAAKSADKMRKGWAQWAKTPEARIVWLKNLEKINGQKVAE